ncbi:ATP-dependent DNA ligase (plasmid) [Cytobacillus oceanisediminis]|nr:ATP-dependent DNA ligase [Cytobacillus oceanisediminis]
MLLHKADEPFDDSNYLAELKLDGIRFLYTVDLQGRVRMYTRHKTECTSRFPELQDLGLPPGTVLDGEIVVTDVQGKPDFEAMMQRFMSSKSGHKVSFVAFDILMLNGESVRHMPLTDRKDILDDLITEDTPLLSKMKFIEGNGVAMFELIKQQSLEGIVLKKKNSKYEANHRSHSWLKVINWQYDSCFVTGWRKEEFGWVLSDAAGNYMGIMELGVPKEQRRQMYKEPVIKETDKISYIKPVPVDIKYRNYTKSGLFRLPSLVKASS